MIDAELIDSATASLYEQAQLSFTNLHPPLLIGAPPTIDGNVGRILLGTFTLTAGDVLDETTTFPGHRPSLLDDTTTLGGSITLQNEPAPHHPRPPHPPIHLHNRHRPHPTTALPLALVPLFLLRRRRVL